MLNLNELISSQEGKILVAGIVLFLLFKTGIIFLYDEEYEVEE